MFSVFVRPTKFLGYRIDLTSYVFTFSTSQMRAWFPILIQDLDYFHIYYIQPIIFAIIPYIQYLITFRIRILLFFFKSFSQFFSNLHFGVACLFIYKLISPFKYVILSSSRFLLLQIVLTFMEPLNESSIDSTNVGLCFVFALEMHTFLVCMFVSFEALLHLPHIIQQKNCVSFHFIFIFLEVWSTYYIIEIGFQDLLNFSLESHISHPLCMYKKLYLLVSLGFCICWRKKASCRPGAGKYNFCFNFSVTTVFLEQPLALSVY